MKQSALSAAALIFLLPSTPAQTIVSEDEVVVSINDVDYTRAHIERIRQSLPDAFRQQTLHMNNRAFLETFAYLQTLSALAEQDKLLLQHFSSQFFNYVLFIFTFKSPKRSN